MSRSRRVRFAAPLLCLLAGPAAHAQDPYDPPPNRVPARIGPEFQVNVHAFHQQHHADVALDATGNSVFVWVSETQPDATSRALYARRFDYLGEPQTGDLPVHGATAVAPSGGRVAMAPDGGFVVAWASPDDGGVHARCFSPLAAALGPPVRLDTGGQQESTRPDVAITGQGEALVVWAERRIGTDLVRVRRLAPGCAPGATVEAGTVATAGDVGIAASPAGWVAAWSGGPSEPLEAPSLWARPFAPDGTPLHSALPVDPGAVTVGDRLRSPVPLARPGGGFAVVWRSEVFGQPQRTGVFARTYSPAFVGGPIATLSAESWPGAVAATPFLEGALVVWSRSGRTIVGRVFDAQWTPLAPEFPVNEFPYDNHEDPAVATNAQRSAEGVPYGSWVAAYSSGMFSPSGLPADRTGEDTQDGSYFGVFAQRFAVAATLASATQLFLADRFEVSVRFRKPDGTFAAGQAFPLTADTGGFWFFDAGNPELLVKIVDGRAVNGRFWVFYGSLTDVEYDLVVRHESYYAFTRERIYHNPQGTMASGADVDSFGECDNCSRSGPSPAASTPRVSVVRLPMARAPAPTHPPVPCTGTATELCLRGGRFQASVAWKTRDGAAGEGRAVRLSDNGGYFWFFDPAIVELLVKVLDGTAVNGHQWVFYASLTDVEFTLTVGDLAEGHSIREYRNPPGVMASHADTSAF
ncbi:MAG TPA: hypothetical protein VF121_14200 [Thermoanaerobaculia bacterium]|nr:hypothetical protein [Thermoanaerobaculia bacterium]